MTKILDRYASAVHSSNLASKPMTVFSDSDVLGAAGLAGKRNGLAMALCRLFSGDNTAAHDLVRTMAEMVCGKSRALGVKLKRPQAVDMARAVLAWKRDGVCRPCGGHGFELIPGTKTVGGTSCRHCRGTGKLLFDRQFTLERLSVARWLLAEIEREQGKAGAAAMAKLAPRLDFGA
jgi:DnaJ-class molecular chaperone